MEFATAEERTLVVGYSDLLAGLMGVLQKHGGPAERVHCREQLQQACQAMMPLPFTELAMQVRCASCH